MTRKRPKQLIAYSMDVFPTPAVEPPVRLTESSSDPEKRHNRYVISKVVQSLKIEPEDLNSGVQDNLSGTELAAKRFGSEMFKREKNNTARPGRGPLALPEGPSSVQSQKD